MFKIILVILSLIIIAFFLWIVASAIIAAILFHRFPPKRFLSVLCEQNRLLSIKDINPHTVALILSSEDNILYHHKGFNKCQILKSIKSGIKEHTLIGGSTITQQLAKNLYLSFRKSFTRKLIETFLTVKIEHSLSKDEILTLYLNLASFGNNLYGIKDASMFYFDLTADKIADEQSYLFVSMLRGDYANNPLLFPDNFKNSVINTLNQFISWDRIDKEEYNKVLNYYTDDVIKNIGAKHKNQIDLDKLQNQKILLYNPVAKRLRNEVRKESK